MNWNKFKPAPVPNPFATPKMPTYDEIPAEFKEWNARNKWNNLFNHLFFMGITITELKPKKGIDGKIAIQYLIQWAHSFEPSHEHKEAAFAYMASIWFNDIKYEKNSKIMDKLNKERV